MRPAPRLFVEFSLCAGAVEALSEEQSNYLSRVLRLTTGAAVRLFNGRDGEWRADLIEVGRKAVTVRVEALIRVQPKVAAPSIELWFAPIKKARTDFIVEKATELGVRAMRPVITARTQSDRVRIDRLMKIAIEAAEQTERLDTPDVLEPGSLTAALDGLAANSTLIFCDEAGDERDAPWGGEAGRAVPIADVLKDLDAEACVLLIGPEGGFTAEERAMLRGHARVCAVSLGPRILRAETAATAALAVWQSMVGDWR